jgi:GNAT superfamily N-acetyltransferase
MKHAPILRPGRLSDAEPCGLIAYEAFRDIAEHHSFPPDFPRPEDGIELMRMLLSRPDVFSVVAEIDGRIVGSNFLWEEEKIAGVGPITVSPAAQDASVGRRLMEAVIERTRERGLAGVRLVQAAYHSRSLSLYAKLGFVVREPLATLQGPPLGLRIEGRAVRPATLADVDTCSKLCIAVHGHDRRLDLQAGIEGGSAMVVEHAGAITGYASAIGFFGHAAGESNRDLQALIGAAPAILGPGILVPTRNSDLFLWCLERGFRVVHTMTLMTRGLYNEPAGPFLPSVCY